MAYQLFFSGRPVPPACCSTHIQMFEKTHSVWVALWLALPGHLGPQGLPQLKPEELVLLAPHICANISDLIYFMCQRWRGTVVWSKSSVNQQVENAAAFRHLFDRLRPESTYRCSYWWLSCLGSLTIAALMTSPVSPSAHCSAQRRLWVCLQRCKTAKVLCVCVNWSLMALIAGNTLL